ncbi:Uncharacterised protein [Chromobacterium violaceum]|uniref:Uncharacterized protein n=1 Tax=Chromobacterium violaceum TaxID=536 RepID=A0A3S4IG48_CHRVL|nr:Uncharacterised protein [Chromobacterium violaceum]
MFKLAVFEKDSDNFTDGYVFWNWLNREPSTLRPRSSA